MREIGCTDVLFALQENHFQWLNGAVRYGSQIAKDEGLRPSMVLWGYANTSGGGRSSRVMLENPDMWRCGPDGNPVTDGAAPHACYNNPKALEFFKNYIRIASEHGFEGVLIDEPVRQHCFCHHCTEKFRHLFGGSLAAKKNTPEYRAFQDETVLYFARSSCEVIKAVNPALETQLCLMPTEREYMPSVSQFEALDVLAVDPYWIREINNLSFEDAIEVTLYAKGLAAEAEKKFELYLGCFGIPAGREEEIYTGGKILVDESAPYRATTWSFRGGLGLCNHPNEEECERPEVAWQSIVRLYEELSTSARQLTSGLALH